MSQDLANEPADSVSVTISGGSMGGLFTGIALDSAGHDVTIAEQSTGTLRSRGGGIVAQQSIRQFLSRHDIVDPTNITTRASERRFLTANGDVRTSKADSMVFTSWDAVYRQLRAAFPDDRYHTGRTVTGIRATDGTVRFADGEQTTTELVVAADGGQSTAREQLFPDTEATFADYVAWRGVVPEADLSDTVIDAFDGRFTFYQGERMLILAYFIPGGDGSTAPGDRRLNWVWYDTLSGRERETVFTDTTGTNHQFSVSPGQLQDPVETRQRERATEILPPVFADLVATTATPFVQAIYDLQSPQMTVGRACLLGDAAFVARPHTAAGTAKAASDAVELKAALGRHSSLGGALASWDEARTDYGERLVAQGKRMGDERLSLGS
ncbi:FAD-dependent monooxygenase [Haloarcula sp. CBA1130]|nr:MULTISPECIES: FAD binding domain-containing protein [unclassified Haloarcula]KAA9396062.1 FAD-dependent monooxygenase [Haloarcula sp. CBA1129]KAA9400407.1 FAD-dependent monooxygenase [Haloarcula sp. CBA1130]